jgi:hypothetical protein
MRPTRYYSPHNTFLTTIGDQSCKVKDIFGNALPGASSDGTTPQCAGTTVAVHMLEGDLNNDCRVDVADDQSIAFRYGSVAGYPDIYPWYSSYFDLEPWVGEGAQDGDGDIDIKDLQFVFGRNYSTCSNPILPDQRAGG